MQDEQRMSSTAASPFVVRKAICGGGRFGWQGGHLISPAISHRSTTKSIT